MEYRVYKLSFSAPCHFGASAAGAGLEATEITCQADTLFSAIANECIALYGEEGLAKLVSRVEQGSLLFSDVFPFSANALFLPKPLWIVKRKADSEALAEVRERMAGAKKLKKTRYIPVYDFEAYIDALRTGSVYTPQESLQDVCRKELVQRVNCREEENLPYFVEQVVFKADCGLYFIAAYKEAADISVVEDVLQSLQYSGIGGKRSSGYGKFTFVPTELADRQDGEDTTALYQLLQADTGSVYMSLANVVPQAEEIDKLQQACYQLLPRSGFAAGTGYGTTPAKRNRYFALSQGSCFRSPVQGQILNVAGNGKQPVFRYGKGLYVRVAL